MLLYFVFRQFPILQPNRTVGDRIQPTVDAAEHERAKYAAKGASLFSSPVRVEIIEIHSVAWLCLQRLGQAMHWTLPLACRFFSVAWLLVCLLSQLENRWITWIACYIFNWRAIAGLRHDRNTWRVTCIIVCIPSRWLFNSFRGARYYSCIVPRSYAWFKWTRAFNHPCERPRPISTRLQSIPTRPRPNAWNLREWAR